MPQYDQRYTAGTFLVHLDQYGDGIFRGQFYHPHSGECMVFHGLAQLLLQMEQLMNVEDLPQSFNVVRTFLPWNGIDAGSASSAVPRMGKVATFALQVLFRRNASWQGTLFWLEGKQRKSFRSVLELITLISSCVEAKQMQLRQELDHYVPMELAE